MRSNYLNLGRLPFDQVVDILRKVGNAPEEGFVMVNRNIIKALGLLVMGCEPNVVVGTNHGNEFDESLMYLISNWSNDDERIIRHGDVEIHIEKGTDHYGFTIMIQKYPKRLWLRWK